MKRMIRTRRLTQQEAAQYKVIRDKVAEELPDLIARHHERLAPSSNSARCSSN